MTSRSPLVLSCGDFGAHPCVLRHVRSWRPVAAPTVKNYAGCGRAAATFAKGPYWRASQALTDDRQR